MALQLTDEQIAERTAILRRFRSLLEEQRNKFREYLSVLERQEAKISEEDGDALIAHAELEQQIVKNISSLQRVIEPVQTMYNAVNQNEISPEEHEKVRRMQNDLADLQFKVLEQNRRNRELLKVHLEQIKEQLYTMTQTNPYRGKRSVYAEKTTAGNLVAIEV